MNVAQRVIIHIGIHSTGGDALQAFLGMHRRRLALHGAHYYAGYHLRNNHVELHTAVMRADRLCPFTLRWNIRPNIEYIDMVRKRVATAIGRSGCLYHLFSTQGLSYLRYPDELDQLEQLFPMQAISIIVYLRNHVEFCQAYRAQVAKHRWPLPITPDSVAYTDDDSWLFRFADRVKLFQDRFGEENVSVLDYDTAITNEGSIIPSYLRAVGLSDHFSVSDWNRVYLV